MIKSRRYRIALLFLAFLPAIVHAQLFPAPDYPESTALLTGPENGVEPGTSVLVNLILSIPSNWHTYWSNPGDGGAPAIIEWTLPEGFLVGEPLWPLPGLFQEDQNIIYGLEGDVRVSFPFVVEEDVPVGIYTLRAEIEWLYCGPICISSFAALSLEITIDHHIPVDSDTSGSPEYWMPKYDQIEGRIITTADGYQIRVPSSAFNAISADELWFYPYKWGWIDQSADQRWIRHGDEFVGNLIAGALEPAKMSGLVVVRDENTSLLGFSVESEIEPGKIE